MGIEAHIAEFDLDVLILIVGKVDANGLPFIRRLFLHPLPSGNTARPNPYTLMMIVTGIPLIGLERQCSAVGGDGNGGAGQTTFLVGVSIPVMIGAVVARNYGRSWVEHAPKPVPIGWTNAIVAVSILLRPTSPVGFTRLESLEVGQRAHTGIGAIEIDGDASEVGWRHRPVERLSVLVNTSPASIENALAVGLDAIHFVCLLINHAAVFPHAATRNIGLDGIDISPVNADAFAPRV